jgi:hypothetical protein
MLSNNDSFVEEIPTLDAGIGTQQLTAPPKTHHS